MMSSGTPIDSFTLPSDVEEQPGCYWEAESLERKEFKNVSRQSEKKRRNRLGCGYLSGWAATLTGGSLCRQSVQQEVNQTTWFIV